MTLIANDAGNGPKLPPVNAGTHTAVCTSIIDLGLQETKYQDEVKTSRKVNISWELADETYTDDDGVEHPRSIGKTYGLSLHEKANLRKMIQSWRGAPFTDEEIKGFDLRKLLGKPCMISVSQQPRRDGQGVYAQIDAVMGLPKGMPAPVPSQLISFDIDDDNAIDAINTLPNWVQETIKKSPSWAERLHQAESPWPSDADAPPVGDMGGVPDAELPF